MSKRRVANPQPRRIWRDWRVLCDQIGERRAGSEGERRAVEYIAKTFERIGADVHVETFPCTSLRKARARMQIRQGQRWRNVPVQILVGAPGTPAGRWVEGAPAWLEMPEDLPRLKRGSLRSKIAMLFGPLPTDAAEHRRLLAAEPLAAVQIDERLPFDWLKNDGVYPYWVRRHGMCPYVTVPYRCAWQWRQQGLQRMRLAVSVELAEAASHNVIAELGGSDPNEPILVLGAHHDTQCNNVGADDDASGVVLLLEMARLLEPMRRRRTIRLITFGTEEQLSVGSAAYVRRHRGEMKRIGMMLNFDSLSSPLGHTHVRLAASGRAERMILQGLRRGGLSFREGIGCTPFTDQFSFAAAGVPTVDFGRGNTSGGRWQHHSVYDNLENVSAEPLCAILRAAAPLVHKLATMREPPFERRIDAQLRRQIRKYARDLYGFAS